MGSGDVQEVFEGEEEVTRAATVLSLGAGVQSSALLLMSDRGEIERADFAVFADTQAEPDEVYRWLAFLIKQVSIPVIMATKGSLVEDSVNSKQRVAWIPFFVKNPDGSQGIARRQCTSEYKLDVVYKAVRSRLGYLPRERVKHKVRMLIGISCDETYRMKQNPHKWATNVYPLVDGWKTRLWASDYVLGILGKKPPRSACYVCPYHSNEEWRGLRDNDPAAFKKAVEFDAAIRKQDKFKGENFLHRDMKPLDQVNLDDPAKDQVNMFNNECEGMCGV